MTRALAGLVLAVALSAAAPIAAEAASYPPASTGTFAVTAHPGENPVTVNGLGAHAKATAIVAGSGPAPTLGSLGAGIRTATANLPVGMTDSSGSVTFTLDFAAQASGVYNVSVSTPDGHSVSGSITIPTKSGHALAWTGTTIALSVVWLAGVLIVIGLIVQLISVVRSRARS